MAEHAVALMPRSTGRYPRLLAYPGRKFRPARPPRLRYARQNGPASLARENRPCPLIRILRGFGMEVLGYDPCPDEAFARESGMTYVPLTELYRRSDIISLHCPPHGPNPPLIDAEAIGQMKDGVIIINTGRGQLIRTSDLIEGLKEKRSERRGWMSMEEEADYFYQDTSDRIMDERHAGTPAPFNNVILTSHQGFLPARRWTNIARTTSKTFRHSPTESASTK